MAEAAATPEDRVVLYAARKEKMRELKKQEARGRLLLECVVQMYGVGGQMLEL